MTLLRSLIFGVCAGYGIIHTWPTWLVVILIVLCILCLLIFLAKRKVFGNDLADFAEDLIPFDGPDGDSGFDFFDE